MKPIILLWMLSAPIAATSPAVAAPRKTVALQWPTFRAVASKKSVPDVTAIQYLLRSRGFYHSKPDGVFGAQTAASVRAFQRKNGLKADGIVAAQTLAKLIKVVKRGDKGDVVRALQTLMREPMQETGDQPFKSLAVDGNFATKTDHLVRYIQSNWIGSDDGPKIKSDGVAGPQTWCYLFGGELK